MKLLVLDEPGIKASVIGSKTSARRVISRQPDPNGLHYARPPYAPADLVYVGERWRWILGAFAYGLDNPGNTRVAWNQPRAMPAEHARLFLRLTEVYPEPLRAITEEEVYHEGFFTREAFIANWDQNVHTRNQKKHCWAANPWVWVIHYNVEEVKPTLRKAILRN